MVGYDNLKVVIRNEKDFYELTEHELGNRRVLLAFDNDEYNKLIFFEFIKTLDIVNYKYELDNLPSNLESLIFSSFRKYNKPLDSLPFNLKYLLMPTNYELEFNFLPMNLEELILPCGYNNKHNIENLPKRLKRITIDYDKNILESILEFKYLEKITLCHDDSRDNTDIIQEIRNILGENVKNEIKNIRDGIIEIILYKCD